jgi:N-acetylmuramic acid 6-phosphate etherase
MSTEGISPRYLDLDLWENIDVLKALYEGQLAAVAAVGPALAAIAAAAEEAVSRLRAGGRLVYVGAGTSGRIGVQDGAELAPTFAWPADRVAFVLAGGEGALLRSVEGAEDLEANGAARIEALGVGANDVVIGLAASGTTPFTLGAVKAARTRGALTLGIANNAGAPLLAASDHAILIETGEEPLAGSTRLKAATAQKVALNLFSTLTMTRLGGVYRGLMVQVSPANAKLRRRGVEMVKTIANASKDIAEKAIVLADGDVKRAVLIACGASLDAAVALLDKHNGNLRSALAEFKS